jgi:hypothetical protein
MGADCSTCKNEEGNLQTNTLTIHDNNPTKPKDGAKNLNSSSTVNDAVIGNYINNPF